MHAVWAAEADVREKEQLEAGPRLVASTPV